MLLSCLFRFRSTNRITVKIWADWHVLFGVSNWYFTCWRGFSSCLISLEFYKFTDDFHLFTGDWTFIAVRHFGCFCRCTVKFLNKAHGTAQWARLYVSIHVHRHVLVVLKLSLSPILWSLNHRLEECATVVAIRWRWSDDVARRSLIRLAWFLLIPFHLDFNPFDV